MDLETARAALAEERARYVYEFEVTRPTPTPPECDLAAANVIVIPKEWDLSPVDPSSFDPFEPPGRPVPPVEPPNNISPPSVSLITDLVVGSMLAASNGTWTGSPTYVRQWKRGAANVGTGGTSYTLVTADIGAMISCDVTATNAGGAVTASSNAVGPIEAAPEDAPNGDDSAHLPTRRKR